MNTKVQENFVSVALAKLALGRLSGDEILGLANVILESGKYSEKLADIAGESHLALADVEPRFISALAELGHRVPTVEEATLLLARRIASQIVSGQVTPYQGARQIWVELANVKGASADLKTFIGLASEYEDATEERFRENYEKLIVEEASILLR